MSRKLSHTSDATPLTRPPHLLGERQKFVQGVRRNFRRHAASYDRHANVQRFMAWALLTHAAPALPQAARILEVGCGTGYLTALLHHLKPSSHLVALDLDPALFLWARRRLGPHPSLSWLAADGEDLPLRNLDLIISNSTFQWFTRPQLTLAHFFQSLRPGGWLAFSTLGPETFRELTAALRQAERLLHPAHLPPIPAAGFLCASHWADLLRQAGFPVIRLEHYPLALHFPSVTAFLKALQATGATNPCPRPFSPRLFKALTAAYLELFGHNAHIPVTYEVILALAHKKG